MAANTFFAVEFFELQLQFAAKVAKVTGMPLSEAIGEYTNIFVRLGMGARLNRSNPEWQAFLAQVSRAATLAELAACFPLSVLCHV